jgi:histidine triad (HIT) family protein
MEDCIFCRIAGGAIPSEIVLEDDTFVAFRDLNPKAPQHVLVVPREHIGSLNDLDRVMRCSSL